MDTAVLNYIYKYLYKVLNKQKMTVGEAYNRERFRSYLHGRLDLRIWKKQRELLNLIHNLSPTEESNDQPRWLWDKSGEYKVAFLYKISLLSGEREEQHEMIWRNSVPYRVRVFA